MKLFILLSFITCSLACSCEKEETPPKKQFYHKDVGIKRAADIKKAEMKALRRNSNCRIKLKNPFENYPYYGGLLITLDTGYKSVCGAALIANNAMLTAAQCWFDGMYQAVRFEVVLGSSTLYYGGLRLVATNIIVHPDYNNETNHADIAIFRIPSIEKNAPEYVSPIAFSVEDFTDDIDITGQWVRTVGYSLTGSAEYSILAAATLAVVTNDECAGVYNYTVVTHDAICAKAITIGGPCKGDYGSPLTMDIWGESLVIGVNSFMVSKGCEAWPPVGFTRVLPFKKWIEGRIGEWRT